MNERPSVSPKKPRTASKARGQRRTKSRRPPALEPRRKPAAGIVWAVYSFGATLFVSAACVLIWAVLDGPGEPKTSVLSFTGRESARETADALVRAGLLRSPRLFQIYFGWFAPSVHVASGSHLLRGDLSPRRLVQRLGRLSSRPSTRVTLPEGFTHLQIGERLEEKEICSRAALADAVRDPALLAELGIAGDSAEGYLFPATYELLVDSDPAQVLRQFAAETRKRLSRLDAVSNGALARLSASRGWGEHEVLTLASMIEREAALGEERPLIASVFLNRLDDPAFRPARMLQSDPTAAYGCQVLPTLAPSCASFSGKVSPEMLRDAANPYNTYRNAGLPPGPIANPGEASILAVLNPAQTNFLYFVADGHARHHFSRTFEEHRRAIGGAGATPELGSP